jgi:hypothetical protein
MLLTNFRRNLKIVQEIVLPRTYNLHKEADFSFDFQYKIHFYLVFANSVAIINLYLVKVVLLN